MAFPARWDFAPVAVALRWDGSRLAGEVVGPRHRGRSSQIARSSPSMSRLGFEDSDRGIPPLVGSSRPFRGSARLLHLPYECAAWAILSQRISMRQRGVRIGSSRDSTRLEVEWREALHSLPERSRNSTSYRSWLNQDRQTQSGRGTAALEGLIDAERLGTRAIRRQNLCGHPRHRRSGRGSTFCGDAGLPTNSPTSTLDSPLGHCTGSVITGSAGPSRATRTLYARPNWWRSFSGAITAGRSPASRSQSEVRDA